MNRLGKFQASIDPSPRKRCAVTCPANIETSAKGGLPEGRDPGTAEAYSTDPSLFRVRRTPNTSSRCSRLGRRPRYWKLPSS